MSVTKHVTTTENICRLAEKLLSREDVALELKETSAGHVLEIHSRSGHHVCIRVHNERLQYIEIELNRSGQKIISQHNLDYEDVLHGLPALRNVLQYNVLAADDELGQRPYQEPACPVGV